MEDIAKLSQISRAANRSSAASTKRAPPPERPSDDAKRKARTRFAMAAPDAADTVIEIMIDKANDAKDRLSASKLILDASGVTRSETSAATINIPAQFLTAALVGIAALAGQDVSAFGDMTDLQDKLTDVTRTADESLDESLVVDVEAEDVTIGETPPAATALTVPREVKHRRRITR